MSIRSKLWKRDEKQAVSKVEENLIMTLMELENSSPEYKKELKDIYIDSVREIEVSLKQKKSKNIILVQIPFVCVKVLAKVIRKLMVELEKRLKMPVLFMAKRTIQSKWITVHKTQKRPRSRTLTAVYDALLDDLIAPSVILGKRIRCRADGTRFYKV